MYEFCHAVNISGPISNPIDELHHCAQIISQRQYAKLQSRAIASAVSDGDVQLKQPRLADNSLLLYI
jgi:hypothetical protein